MKMAETGTVPVAVGFAEVLLLCLLGALLWLRGVKSMVLDVRVRDHDRDSVLRGCAWWYGELYAYRVQVTATRMLTKPVCTDLTGCRMLPEGGVLFGLPDVGVLWFCRGHCRVS